MAPTILPDEPTQNGHIHQGYTNLNDPIYRWLDDVAPPSPIGSNESDASSIIIDTPSTIIDGPDSDILTRPPELDSIKIEFHPASGRPAKITSFGDYGRDHYPDPIPPDRRPWTPFQSRIDFEIAELSLEAALNHSQLDRLIKLVHCAANRDPENSFTIKSAGEMKKVWEEASRLRTPVSITSFIMVVAISRDTLLVQQKRIHGKLQGSTTNLRREHPGSMGMGPGDHSFPDPLSSYQLGSRAPI